MIRTTGAGWLRSPRLGGSVGALAWLIATPALAAPPDPGHYAFFTGVSADGSRAFIETTEPLVARDRDNRVDVYRRQRGKTVWLSRGRINGNGNFGAFYEGSSVDGSRVFFASDERLVPADTDSVGDVYRRSPGRIALVSQGPGLDPGSGARFGSASADGSRVFFEDDAALVAGDADDLRDVYSRAFGLTTLVSGNAGPSDDGGTTFGGASVDGVRAFFDTGERLTGADTDGAQDVYEGSGGGVTLVSSGQVNGNGDHTASFTGASGDGSRVFFESPEPLVRGDTDDSHDVYERFAGLTTQVTVGEINGNTDLSNSTFVGSSGDGSRVFFHSSEQLVPGDEDGEFDVYERSGGATRLVSEGEINGDGRLGAFFKGASSDGTGVFFESEEALVDADLDRSVDVYERSGGRTTLVSAGEINGSEGFDSRFKGAALDGSRVFFETTEPLARADTDELGDVYERAGATTRLVSVSRLDGLRARVAFFDGSSADGGRVFFHTDERMTKQDRDGVRDVYVHAGGVTRLVSVEMVPPRTRISERPGRLIDDRTPAFKLWASESKSRFRCRVDGRRSTCRRRTRLGPLSLGRHVFTAKAIDAAGNRDRSPARHEFVVLP